MPKIEYEAKQFNQKTLQVINQAEEIINIYQSQGFKLTLRQLYYQFVARVLIANTEQSYKRLGSIISDARRAGLIDWNSIEDRTRFLRKLSNWNHPKQILTSARDQYHRDLWAGQPCRIEVWIEKDALVGVIEELCNKEDIPFFSCRGYVSDSEMWTAAQRLLAKIGHQECIILHLGDHDPSGIDMTRDIQERLNLFCGAEMVEVRRIALTMEQIEELEPPPNPAKITDSRYEGYAALWGEESWELDALEPQYITGLILEQIQKERNAWQWKKAVDRQEIERNEIDQIINKWES